jgi:hypothetical protein
MILVEFKVPSLRSIHIIFVCVFTIFDNDIILCFSPQGCLGYRRQQRNWAGNMQATGS